MSRSPFLLGALLNTVLTFGQLGRLPLDSIVDLDLGHSHQLEINGLGDYNANTVFNELPAAILRGGLLTRELRQRSLDALRNKGNSAGYVVEGHVQWSWRTGDKRWRPLVRSAHKQLGGLDFTRDQFAVAFFGNAAYEDRIAELSPSGYEQWRFQTLGFGYRDAIGRSYFRLDLVRGQSFAAVDVREADLYTGIDGRVLRSNLVGDYHASDTAGQGFDRTNGLGLALSGRWNSTLKVGARTIALAVGIEDLGLLRWNDRSVQVRKDTLIAFTGLEVESIFALDDVIIGEETLLDTFGLRYRIGAFTRVMPFRALVSGAIALGARYKLGLEVDHLYLPGYLPQVALQGSRRMGERTLVGTTLSYGGFGAFRWGISAKRRFGEHVLLCLSTPQLPALFSEQARGLGILFGTELVF